MEGVSLQLKQQDTTVAVAISASGRFHMSYPRAGTYQLTASLIGYSVVQRQIALPEDSIQIRMSPTAQSLQAVQIVGKKPVVERKIDRTIIHVDNSAVAGTGTVWETLSKTPGIQAKADNTLVADRKSVQVYQDGKPLHLSGDELASYLQGMPASSISTIEVYSNPPASFDAAGGAVINIVTKKLKGDGLNATVNAGFTQASHSSYNLGGIFNYRKDRLNVYGSYAFTDRTYLRKEDEYIIYTNPSGDVHWNSEKRSLVYSGTHGINLGVDYQLSANQTLGVQLAGTFQSGHSNMTSPTGIYLNERTVPDSTLFTSGQRGNSSDRQRYGISYTLQLDSSKQTLSVDMNYSPYQQRSRQYVNTTTSYTNGQPASDNYRIFTDTEQGIGIYFGNLAYSYQWSKNWRLQAGAKYSSIRSDNRFDFYDNGGHSMKYLPANSNHFLYTERTAALYANVEGAMGRFHFSAGLRGEQTATRGYATMIDSLNKYSYLRLYPTVLLSYKTTGDREWQLRYSYRVERPGYALLNPAKNFFNPYNYLQGNPALQPAFIKNLELSYVFNSAYTLSAFYTTTNSFFSNVTVQDNMNHLFYDTFNNLDLSMSTGLRFDMTLHPTSWWEMSQSVQAYYMREKSAYLDGHYDFQKLGFEGNTLQSFTLHQPSGLKLEVAAYYYSGGIQAMFINGQISNVSAGAKMNVLKGKGTVKLSFNDIFLGNNFREQVKFQAQNNGFYQNNDTRNGNVTFTYRLGGKSVVPKQRAMADEEKRM